RVPSCSSRLARVRAGAVQMVPRGLGRSGVGSLVLMAMAACTSVPPEAASSAVPAPKAFLERLRPADLGREFGAVQLVSVRRDDKVFIAEVRLSVRKDRLMFVAQDMLGQRLMTVTWTDGGIVEERSPNLPALVSPAGMLADLVAIGGPEDAVRRALEQTGSPLGTGPGGGGLLRAGQGALRP